MLAAELLSLDERFKIRFHAVEVRRMPCAQRLSLAVELYEVKSNAFTLGPGLKVALDQVRNGREYAVNGGAAVGLDVFSHPI